MSQTKTHIIEQATELFFTYGYRFVSLDDLAQKVSIKPASLYHHFPGGKEDIFITVIERRFESYYQQIAQLQNNCATMREFLTKFGHWYCSKKQMNMLFLTEMDMPNLSQKGQEILKALGDQKVFTPLNQSLENFPENIKEQYATITIASHYLTLLNSLLPSLKYAMRPVDELVDEVVTILLDGALANSL